MTNDTSSALAARTLTARVTEASRQCDAWAGDSPQARLDRAQDHRARLVHADNDAYPWALKALPHEPPSLYAIGPLNDPRDSLAVAVVGSRKASRDGIDAASEIAGQLASSGHTIVSGMAAGIDAAAHRAALDAGGRTVAFLGTGIDKSYPQTNYALQRRVADQGTLLSQFAPSQGPSKTTFPARNVLIAGMARTSLLVELTEHSGTRIEATITLEQTKPVLLWGPRLAHLQWARDYVASDPLISFVSSVEEIAHAASRRLGP